MTHFNLPHTPEAGTPRAVQTNGEGNATTAHLNQTVTLETWMDTELEGIRRASPQYYEQRIARAGK